MNMYTYISHDQRMSEFNSKHIIYTSVPTYVWMYGLEGGRDRESCNYLSHLDLLQINFLHVRIYEYN